MKDDAEVVGRRVAAALQKNLADVEFPAPRDTVERNLRDVVVDLPSGRHIDLRMAIRRVPAESFQNPRDLVLGLVGSGVLREGGAGDATPPIGDLDAEEIVSEWRRNSGGRFDVLESGTIARGSEPGEPETRRRRDS